MYERTIAARATALLRSAGLLVGFGLVAGTAACGDKNVVAIVPVPPVAGVTTFHDSTFDFTTLNTFLMPDTVVHLTAATGTPIDPSRQFDRTALDAVRRNLLSRGYREVSRDSASKANFIVLVGATATQNYNAFVGYPWFGVWGFYTGWNFYAPGFDTSWNIIYPWYGTVGITAYDRGTLIVDLIPTKSVNPLGKTIQSAWVGVATGQINSSTATAATISNAVDEMFTQSPYLVAGPVVQPVASRAP